MTEERKSKSDSPDDENKFAKMENFVIAFKEPSIENYDAVKDGRSQIYADAMTKSTCLRNELDFWLAQHNLQSEIKYLGPVTVFFTMPIICTSHVADKIRENALVEYVSRDSSINLT